MGIPPSFPQGNMTVSQPLHTPLSLLWPMLKQKESGSYHPSSWHVCNASSAICMRLLVSSWPHSVYRSLSQYMRNKLFSYWFMLCHWLMSKYFWCLKIMTKINHSRCMSWPFYLKKKTLQRCNAKFLSHKITNTFNNRFVWNVQNINKLLSPCLYSLRGHKVLGVLLDFFAKAFNEFSSAPLTALFGAAESGGEKRKY